MTLSLYVDGAQWRGHLSAVRQAFPGLVPVDKGNGYGFGRDLLATEASSLGADTLAVGQATEVGSVLGRFGGDVLVLEPSGQEPGGTILADESVDDRVILTASTLDGLAAARDRRVVVELLSSVRRFGFTDAQLPAVANGVAVLRCEGYALHLPIDARPGERVVEARRALRTLRAVRLEPETLWLSHLTSDEFGELAAAEPDVRFRVRVGTNLWLGDPRVLRARASVLAVHRVDRGDRYGYHQRRALRDGFLVVLSGGTSHGIALSAPSAARGLGDRAQMAAIGALDASGRALSPFTIAGRKRWFAETPHMQVSMVWLPRSIPPPDVGSEVPVEVRMTTVVFDRVILGD
jgi:alanine racemase